MSDPRLARLLLTQEVAEFLYAEAELLDERHYDDWLALLADDIRYWMPMRRNVKYGDATGREFTREGADIAWFDEGKETLTRRVRSAQDHPRPERAADQEPDVFLLTRAVIARSEATKQSRLG